MIGHQWYSFITVHGSHFRIIQVFRFCKNWYVLELCTNEALIFQKWDNALQAEGESLLKTCKKLEHKQNYRVYMFDEKDEDPTKPLISQVKFAEAVKLVNSRSEPFTNMLEWLIPTQNKIACFTGTTCYRKRAVCLLGPK
uniref:Uncharacterized protein n=1 Tax=Caenorhabditis japonica TaxID=281687 RepID=A0A8R1EK42_CAEJA